MMIGGHRIVGQLGSGGQGVVYLGESPEGERVAVKVLRGGDVAAFLAESEMVRRVRTFCTAQVLETGLADGSPYIVSEYVDGPSLAFALARTRPPEERRAGTARHRDHDRRWRPSTGPVSCTATSNRPTCCSAATGRA